MSDENWRRSKADAMRFSAGVGSLVGVFAVGMTIMFLLSNRAG
jgi:hypothetical protein